MDSFKSPGVRKLKQTGSPAGASLINVGVDHVTSKDIVLQVVTELPPGHQLHVDLIASLHLQHDNLTAYTVAITKSCKTCPIFHLVCNCNTGSLKSVCSKHLCNHVTFASYLSGTVFAIFSIVLPHANYHLPILHQLDLHTQQNTKLRD